MFITAQDYAILFFMMDEKAFFDAIQKKTLHGPYYLTGTEEYTKERAVRMAYGMPGDAARELNVLLFKAPNVDPAGIIEACDSLPFFDERKVVIVRDFNNDTALIAVRVT